MNFDCFSFSDRATVLTQPDFIDHQDGTVLFFDVERDSKPCINKLLGHSTPVVSICYSYNEKLLATADQSGQIIVWKKSVN